MRFAVIAIAVLGCKAEEAPPVAEPTVEMAGTFAVGRAPAKLIACRPGHAVHVFVDVETSLGTLRFGEGKLSWDGAELACEKLDRRWGGGVRSDGSSYFRGMLDFRCGQLAGKLELDCGKITPPEAGELAKNAAAARPDSAARGSGSAQSSGSGERQP